MAFTKSALSQNVKLRMVPLNTPKGWEIFNLPKIIKTASISKSNDQDLGGLVLSAELEKHPDDLFVKIFAIKENEPNDNADCFSPEELAKAASTFIGVPIFTNHKNDDIENARGECVHAWYSKEDKGINLIARVDKIAYPKLARSIEEGYATGTSMGCAVGYSCCSICHNKASTAEEFCSHIKESKNRTKSGKYACKFHESDCKPECDCPVCGCKKGSSKEHEIDSEKVFEWNYDLKFIENSFVVNPACHSCGVTCVLHAPEVTKKIAELKKQIADLGFIHAKNPRMFDKAASDGKLSMPIKTASVEEVKIAGQIELDMLKDSMKSLENVTRSMLSQREHIDPEYIGQIIEAMSKLQDTYDELNEMGYAQLQSTPQAELARTGAVQPAEPQQSQQAKAPAPKPAPQNNASSSQEARTELPDGLGSITLPKQSSDLGKNKKESIKSADNLIKRLIIAKNLIEQIDNLTRSSDVSDDFRIESDTNSNIVSFQNVNVWENEDDVNSHHVLVSSNNKMFALAKGSSILEVKTAANLPDNIAKLAETDIRKAAENYLENYLQNIKESESKMSTPTNKTAQTEGNASQQEVITEKQLSKNPPALHPRWNETYEQTTESKEQLGRSDDKSNDTTSESPQKRLGTYETITEDQLAKVTSGYILRTNDAPEVITEKQWTDMSNLVSAKLPDDWTETITQDQLRKLLKDHRFVGTYETITEDQLKNQDSGIKRWASKSYVSQLTKIAVNAISDAIASFKKTPEDIKRVLSSVLNNPTELNKVAFITVLNSLPHKNEERKALMNSVNYFNKVAGNEIKTSTLDAVIVAVAENAIAGTKAEDVFETMLYSLKQKPAMDKVNKIVASKLASVDKIEDEFDKFAALNDAIQGMDGYDIRATVSEIGADPKDKVAFNKACKKFASSKIESENIQIKSIKVAQDAGLVRMLIDALEDVAAKMNGGAADVDVEFVGDGDLGENIENIDGALNGPGGTDTCGGDPLEVSDVSESPDNSTDNSVEEDKPMMGGPAQAPATSQPANAPVSASTNVTKRAAARHEIEKQAQMLGGEMGGQGGAAQAPGAGATVPQPPGQEQQPVETFSQDGTDPSEQPEEEGEKKAKPPGAVCPGCGSANVDAVGKESKCNNCGTKFYTEIHNIITEQPGIFGGEKDGGQVEDEFGGEGFELPTDDTGQAPELPVAATMRLDKGVLTKLAEAKIELGSVSPITGSRNTMSLGDNKWVCLDTGRPYEVEFRAAKSASKDAPITPYARWTWTPPVNQNVCPSCRRARNELIKVLKNAGITEDQFDLMTPGQKTKVLAKIKEFASTSVSVKEGSVLADYKKTYASAYGEKFPIESCREKLARRYGKNALALSGPCEGKPIYDCVCNSLKKAQVYTDNIALKVAETWSDVDGTEDCVVYLVKNNLSLRQAAITCSALKTSLASDEEMFADDLGNDNPGDNGNGGDDNGGNNDGPPTDIDETRDDDFNPFDENSVEDNQVVTLELPLEVAKELDAKLDAQLGSNPADDANAGDTNNPLPGVETAQPDGAGMLSENDLVQEVGGPAELGLETSKPCANAAMNEAKPCSNGNAQQNNVQNHKKQEGFQQGPGEINNFKEGNPVMANGQAEKVANGEYSINEASYMRSSVGGVEKMNGLDYNALAAKLGLKVAGEKEIQQEKVQDSKDIGPFSAGDPQNGKTVGEMGHESETIPDASLPSVPRSDARMGHENENINKEENLPQIPSDKGTLGHESEVGLSGGDVRFTGGVGIGGGSPGAGQTEVKASEDGEIITAELETELRSMRGSVGNSKDREDALFERLATKLQAPKAVSEDEDLNPHSNGKALGHEEPFSAKKPNNTEDTGNGSMMGHEADTLGSVPKSPKDHPDVPEGGTSGALMGHEGDAELNPEKQTDIKGTVIAKSNEESKAARNKEAFRVAARLLKAGVIEETQLENKISQLAQYQPDQIRDYEKAVFAQVVSKNKGLRSVSEGLQKPLIINEASSMKKSSIDEQLVNQIQSLFKMDEMNQETAKNKDFGLLSSFNRI